MEVLILQVFVSLVLVVGSVILFSHSAKQKDHQHAGRLALLPLDADEARRPLGNEPPRSEENNTESRP